jgi:hypothetical protein
MTEIDFAFFLIYAVLFIIGLRIGEAIFRAKSKNKSNKRK